MGQFFRELVLGIVLGPPWRRDPSTRAGRWGMWAALAVWAVLAVGLVILLAVSV